MIVLLVMPMVFLVRVVFAIVGRAAVLHRGRHGMDDTAATARVAGWAVVVIFVIMDRHTA